MDPAVLISERHTGPLRVVEAAFEESSLVGHDLLADGAWLASAGLAPGAVALFQTCSDSNAVWMGQCGLDATSSLPSHVSAPSLGARIRKRNRLMPTSVLQDDDVARSVWQARCHGADQKEGGVLLTRISELDHGIHPARAIHIRVYTTLDADGSKGEWEIDHEAEARLRQAGGGPSGPSTLLASAISGAVLAKGFATRVPSELLGPNRWVGVHAVVPEAELAVLAAPHTTLVLPREGAAAGGHEFSELPPSDSVRLNESNSVDAHGGLVWHPSAIDSCGTPLSSFSKELDELPGAVHADAAARLRQMILLPLLRPDLVGWGSVAVTASTGVAVTASTGVAVTASTGVASPVPRLPQLDPPRGALLHGMKGSGRTSLIEAVAKEAATLPSTRTRVLTIQPQHLLHTDETEAEAVLRRVFRRARRWLTSGDSVDPPALPGSDGDAKNGLVGAASSSIIAREASAAVRSGDGPVSHTAWRGIGSVVDFGNLPSHAAVPADPDTIARVCVIVIEGLDDLLPALPGVTAGGIGSMPTTAQPNSSMEGSSHGDGDGEDSAAPTGAVLGDSEVAFRAHLLSLLEAHCWCHDEEGLGALPGVRVSGDEGVLNEEALHGNGASDGGPVVGCLALDESSADEEDGKLSQLQDCHVVTIAPSTHDGGSGKVGVVSASGLFLGAPGTRAGWRRDSLPAASLSTGKEAPASAAAASGAGESGDCWSTHCVPVAPRRLVVIGTAASRAAVDPAALQSGLLELEVVVDPPHVSDRPFILASILSQRHVELLQDPANDDDEADSSAAVHGKAGAMDTAAVRFAEGLIGYVPGDIVSLVDKASELATLESGAARAREAASRLDQKQEAVVPTAGISHSEDRLRHGMTEEEYDNAWAALADKSTKPDEADSDYGKSSESVRVQLRHLHAAKALVGGSALQGLQTDVQKASWDDVGGLESVKADLVRAVQWPLLHRRVFDRFRVTPPRGILLFGPPGCSKTLLVRALASTSGASFFSLSGADVYSKYVGQAERNLSEAFRRARAARPAVIFLDEVEALVGSRGGETASETDGGASSGVLATLLTEMDGTETVEGVVVVAATNRPAALDAALLRPGRFGLRLAVGPPNADGRLAILKVHTRSMTLSSDVDLLVLARRCDRFTGAELEALCRYAGTEAQREYLSRYSTPRGHAGPTSSVVTEVTTQSDTLVVAAAHFEAAIGQLSTLFGGPGGEVRLERDMQAMRKFASGASATGAAAMLGRARGTGAAFGVAEVDPAAVFGAAAAGGTA